MNNEIEIKGKLFEYSSKKYIKNKKGKNQVIYIFKNSPLIFLYNAYVEYSKEFSTAACVVLSKTETYSPKKIETYEVICGNQVLKVKNFQIKYAIKKHEHENR